MTGSVGILNVGAGDTKLVFDPTKPEEMKRAARIVTDMLKRGYVLLAEVMDAYGKVAYQRVHEFNEDACEYIITDDQPEESDGQASEDQRSTRRRGRPRTRAVSASTTRSVAVARTAGG